MNTYLCRAKRSDHLLSDNTEWVIGYPVFGNKHSFLVTSCIDKVFPEQENLSTNAVEIDKDTLCQSVEMRASWDGPECETEEALVWEHDLLEVDYEGKKVIAEVKFECGMFILASNEFIDSYIPLFDVVQLEDRGWIDAKVVGNIFDNPELLKEHNLYYENNKEDAER